MGALCAVIAIIAVVIPFAQGSALLGTVPMGLLAYRYRLRVLIAATVAAGMIAFLIAGLGSFVAVIHCAYIGGLTGSVKRRGRGRTNGDCLVLDRGSCHRRRDGRPVGRADSAAALNFSGNDRECGRRRCIPGSGASAGGQRRLEVVLRLRAAVLAVADVRLCHLRGDDLVVDRLAALSRLLERMRNIPDVHKLDAPDGIWAQDAAIGPVPVRLDRVRFRYPHASQDALSEVSLDVRAGEHVAVTGANGSGKTTLTLILAGREPTSGTVNRPGAVGLGMLGGTALVLQHPQSQVLGTRVADDVVWGLPPGTEIDVSRLLREVGLEGLAERDTGSLSGGELQRLALAAALAREPALLIADEVTSMIDQQGRDDLLDVLSGLRERHRICSGAHHALRQRGCVRGPHDQPQRFT